MPLCAASTDKTGYLVGSIEGRVAVQHVEESVGQTKNFTFKCHREGADIYAVNTMSFHPQHGTFVTAGSDGCVQAGGQAGRQTAKHETGDVFGGWCCARVQLGKGPRRTGLPLGLSRKHT